MNRDKFAGYTKERLLDLIEIYSKNWLATDGVWFQSVEQKSGMDEAIYHDEEAWRRFAAIEARRLKGFLGLGDRSGLEGLKAALALRMSANVNETVLDLKENELICTLKVCRVQSARSRKGMPLHPCKPVGEIEFSVFAANIDPRIKCECLSCYPEVTDPGCGCKWRFYISEGSENA